MGIEDRRDGFVLPERIGRLYELAHNLWWSWHEEGRQVFRSLDYGLWRTTGHNPVRQLREMSPERLQAAAVDPAFLELYDSVMARLDADMRGENTWVARTHPARFHGPLAYFSAEFALHGSLPIYAGGLGVLAGDICKESSDLGLPLVAVGFMYPQGYFRQRISPEGRQEEIYTQLNFNEAPINPCPWPQACGPLVSIPLAGGVVYAATWEVRVGRTRLYLLDTHVEENSPQDRTLSARLYTADAEQRIQQIILLGVCGVRVLRLLGIHPSVWHGNEDHTAFMMLERLREEMAQGLLFEEAAARVRATTIFTTHTPIPAGQNIFPVRLVDRYFRSFWEMMGIERQKFLELGRYPGLEPERFSLAALALRLAGQSNAVSRLHGQVTRRMWQVLWPGKTADEVPITQVTNGVHLPTWQAPEMLDLCRKYLAGEWLQNQDDPESWKCILEIPDGEFWEVRQLLKTRLIRLIQDRAQQRWVEDGASPLQVLAMGALLDPYVLTIAFARRFTEYKRAHLVLRDAERLKSIVNNPSRPVQIIFAGKSHPADLPSKELLRRVYRVAMDRSFHGRIAFLEDYDLHLARELVRGVDLWLNTPRRLQEACGTSGMKASLNGVINFSVRDGWWDEGYNGANGWAINGSQAKSGDEDRADAEALYSLLEKEIIPLYYNRDRRGVPHGWIRVAKEAIRSVASTYCAQRMLKEYTARMYLPAIAEGNVSGWRAAKER